MDFIQATRHIFPLFKLFAITPFDISGPPCQRHIQKNRKMYFLGNIFLTSALGFMVYQLWSFSQSMAQFVNLVDLLLIVMLFFNQVIGTIETVRNNHKFIQIYHEFIQISDSQPNSRKFFKQIFYFFIFKISFFTINLILEYTRYFIEMYYNYMPIGSRVGRAG